MVSRGTDSKSGAVPAADPTFDVSLTRPDGTLAPGGPSVHEVEAWGATPDYVFGADDRIELGQANMTVYPWRTIGRTWAIFPDGAQFSGTAALIGSRTLLTAGHIVYDASHGGWASQLYFSAGQDGDAVYDSFWGTNFKRSNYQYYGEARALSFQTYNGWISGDWNYDIAYVALDRNLGSYTGWMGWGYNDDNSFFQNSTFNTAGYPGDLTPNEYDMWYTFGGLTTVNTLNLQTQIDTWPGQSGSPLWYLSGGNRTMYATNSSQWTVGGVPAYNQFARITGQRFADMNSYVSSWGAAADQPDLVDWDQWFDSQFAYFSSSTITPGHSFTVHSYPRNNGTAAAGSFRVDFYASTNTTISASDYFIGSATISSLGALQWADASYSGAFPYIPDGNYYVGWIIDAGNTQNEYAEYDNTGVIDYQWLTVVSPPDVGDTLATARSTGIGLAGGAYYDSNPIGNWFYGAYDVDLFQFQGSTGATVTIDTAQPLGGLAMDTIVRLFDANGVQLGYDDDGGPGYYSHLSYTLPASGTYYVGVSGFSNFSYNPFVAVSGTAGSTGEFDIAISVTGDPIAPRIGGSAVTLGSTTGVHAAYVVPTGSGEQLRTIPVGGINQIGVAFDQHVIVNQGDLTLLGAGAYSFSSFAYDSNTATAVWTLASPLPAGSITLQLSDSVQDPSGNALDGEWTNPTGLTDPTGSVLSGDGIAGGAFEFRFTVLPGDANRDNQVTGADYTLWADNYGQWAGIATTAHGDFNGDGFVTGADYTIWADHYGANLQSPVAPTGRPTARAPLAPMVEELPLPAMLVSKRDRLAAARDAVLAAWEGETLKAAFELAS